MVDEIFFLGRGMIDDDDVMMIVDDLVGVYLVGWSFHCVMMIIDDDLIISLSSLKKNRKATFDVLFWGVLYSAFFVSMMEWGSRI